MPWLNYGGGGGGTLQGGESKVSRKVAVQLRLQNGEREILTVRALRSSRTIEYYVLLSLRTIEKRKDWI